MFRIKGKWGWVEAVSRGWTKWTPDPSKAMGWGSATEACIAIIEFDIPEAIWEMP